MRKTILLLLLLFCVVLFCTGAKGCDVEDDKYSGTGTDVDIDPIPVCDAGQTSQECEDVVEMMPEEASK